MGSLDPDNGYANISAGHFGMCVWDVSVNVRQGYPKGRQDPGKKWLAHFLLQGDIPMSINNRKKRECCNI